jgi:hypothetical protein
MLILSAVQVFCGNDLCRMFCWDASATAAENLHVDIDALPAGPVLLDDEAQGP